MLSSVLFETPKLNFSVGKLINLCPSVQKSEDNLRLNTYLLLLLLFFIYTEELGVNFRSGISFNS